MICESLTRIADDKVLIKMSWWKFARFYYEENATFFGMLVVHIDDGVSFIFFGFIIFVLGEVFCFMYVLLVLDVNNKF